MKKNPFLFGIKIIVVLILVLLLIIVGAGLFCMLDRKQPLSVLPQGFSAYVHVDSVWAAAEPLLDLQAAEVLLSSPDLVQYRQPFMQFRTSPLRENKAVAFAASRQVDAALYKGTGNSVHFVGVVNLGFLSLLTRPLKYYAKYLSVPQVSYVDDAFSFLQYQNEQQILYVKPYKNLLLISDTFDLLSLAYNGNNDESYSPSQRALLTKKTDKSVRIVVDAPKLVGAAAQGNALLEQLATLLSKDTLSVISFDITDEEITLTTEIPLTYADDDMPAVRAIVQKNATMPSFLTRMSDLVQYYTILHAGTLQELKDALFPFIPADKNAESSWQSADTMCHTFFSLSLEDLLYSWTGTEFAVFGMEGQSDPVFALQIADESKRQAVFEKILSSFLVNDDTSLILGGVRLPKLVFPGFLQKLLSLFDISLPSPYYLVQDGFLYFSESSESLAAIYNAANDGRKLSQNKNWLAVSRDQKADATVSLYYDLEHSIPFFLRNGDNLTRILALYTIGRADMRLHNAVMTCQLHAVARRSGDLREIAGFPLALSAQPDGNLYGAYDKNTQTVFWAESDGTVHALDLASMQQQTLSLSDTCTLATATRKRKGDGVLWAVTAHGVVYLLTRELTMMPGFPVLLDEEPTAPATAAERQLIIPQQHGITFVTDTGSVSEAAHTLSGSIKAAPSVSGNTVAIYDKGFAGKILIAENGSFTEDDGDERMQVSGIAYGSPAVIKTKDALWVAFITQAGNLYLWKNYALVEGFPQKLDGIFYTNVVASSDYFYALSDTAVLYRIAKDGSRTSVAIPHATAKNAFITVTNARTNGSDDVYVCADANMIYGFKENMELISGFPIVGWGVPVFADVNGDKLIDVLALTMDKKLVAWNLR